MLLRYLALLSACAIGNAWVMRPSIHGRHRPLPLRSSAPTSENQEPSAEFLESYLSRFTGASATKTVDGVEFVKFDNSILFGSDDPRAAVDDTIESEKEVLLYMPGLDFTGVSGCGALPILSSRYEVWWTRVENTYRGDFATIAATVSEQVIALSDGGQRKVTLLGESFGGLLALGVALRVRDHANVNVASELVDNAAATSTSSSSSVLRGAVLVNAASGFDQTPWLALGSLLAKLPSQTLADLDLPTALTSALAAGGISQLPRVSPFSAVAAAVLATTVPDVSQVVRGTSGLLGDLLANNGPEAAASKAAARASQAVGALDRLATNLAPEVLQFRLEKWLKAGCEEVNPRLAELGDTKEAIAAAASARKAAGMRASDTDFFATALAGEGLPILALAGEEDRMLPSSSEAMRLVSVLGKRTASGKILAGVGHAALDDRPNFLGLIDASPLGLATRAEASLKAQEGKPAKAYDYVTGFVPPNATQLEAARASLQNFRAAVSPVFISTDATTGRRRFGLDSVPLPKDVNRPVLLVGNHQLLALDLGIMVEEFVRTTGSLPRGLAHPATFVDPATARGGGNRRRQRIDPLDIEEGTAGPFSPFANLRKAQAAAAAAAAAANQGTNEPQSARDPVVAFNGVGSFQEFGAVPVTPKNFYKMMQQNEFALLFPGGAREATHSKGEDYALFWPKDRAADFVRVAAKFDALVVPFGAVGAADSLSILFSPEELKGIAKDASDFAGAISERLQEVPILQDLLKNNNAPHQEEERSAQNPFEVPEAARLWSQDAEQAQDDIRFPLALPSPNGPARFYFSFGAPVDLAALDPRDRAACADTNSQIKAAVQSEINWLLQRRKDDPFAALPPRVLYEQLNQGQQAPTFTIATASDTNAQPAATEMAWSAPAVPVA